MTNFPWRTALFVSLALNLVVISAGVGAIVAGARLERPGPHAGFARPMGPRFMEALPPEARRELRQNLADDMRATTNERSEARNARQALYDAAGAETYDVEAVKAAFARVRASEAALQTTLHDRLAQRLANLPADQRRAAIQAMTEGPRGMRRGGRWRRGPGGPDGEGEGFAPPAPPEAPN